MPFLSYRQQCRSSAGSLMSVIDMGMDNWKSVSCLMHYHWSRFVWVVCDGKSRQNYEITSRGQWVWCFAGKLYLEILVDQMCLFAVDVWCVCTVECTVCTAVCTVECTAHVYSCVSWYSLTMDCLTSVHAPSSSWWTSTMLVCTQH